MDARELCTKLAAPFSAKDVEWKPGATKKKDGKVEAALAMPYIDSRAIMDRLDSVVGPENWEDHYELTEKGVLCELRVRLDGEWVTKTDGAPYSDVEPFKGAVSGALKRAAVKWGLGRYLYQVAPRWVKHDGYKFLETPTLPENALPESERKGAKKQPARPAEPAADKPAAAPVEKEKPAEQAAPAAAVKPDAAPVAPAASVAGAASAAASDGGETSGLTDAERKVIDRVVTRVKESGGSNIDAAKEFINNHTELSADAKKEALAQLATAEAELAAAA